MKKANKIDRKFNSSVVVATVCIVAAGWITAWAQDSPFDKVQEPPQEAQTTATPSQPLKLNKCSQLIGATVENPKGDKLGKIDEVVVDFQNGRVSYCVLSVEHK